MKQRGPLAVCTLGVAVFSLPALLSNAQSQTNWKPNRYQVHCDRSSGCLPAGTHHRISGFLTQVVNGMQSLQFRAPQNWRPLVKDANGSQVIRVFDTGDSGIAQTLTQCKSGETKLRVGQGIQKYSSKLHLMFYFFAHEVFHLVQKGYPGFDQNDCRAPGWVSDGSADAVGLYLTRKRYPNKFPGGDSEREAGKFSGIRRYDVPLNVKFAEHSDRDWSTGVRVQYQTSSFWRHISDAYHGGSPAYLHNFFRVAPEKRDWLGWLTRRLLVDPKIRADLGPVFAGFVADYAGWGERGQPGEYFGRDKWLNRSFGGCSKAVLTPKSSSQVIKLDLRRTAAECVQISVAGIKKGDRVSVKVAAFKNGGTLDHVDQVHLSRAWSSDSENFSCTRETRRASGNVLKKCVFVPDTGTVTLGGKATPARVWQVQAQEITRGAGFENMYLVSRTAVKPTDAAGKKSEGGEVLKVEVAFSLDVSSFTVSAPSTGGGDKKRSIAQFNHHAIGDAQERVPLTGVGGKEVRSYANPGPVAPGTATLMPPQGSGGLYAIRVAQAAISKAMDGTDDVDDEEQFMLMPGLESGLKPLQIGSKGRYRIGITGGFGMSQYIAKTPGFIDVDALTAHSMRARFSGTVCRLTAAKGCPGARRIQGTLVKAFPMFYVAGNALQVTDTPGTKQYRNMLEASRGGSSANDTSPAGEGSQGAGAGSATTKSGCDCSCAGFAKMKKLGEKIDRSSGAARQKAMNQMTSYAACIGQCQGAYMSCAKKE